MKNSEKQASGTMLEFYGLVWTEIASYFNLSSHAEMEKRMKG